MSNEGDRAAVLRTTKVRTKLRGDGSWLQRSSEPKAETQEEKPWIAEVKASRLNGAPIETSPVSSPTKPTPPTTKSDTERAPTSGYLIRGVLTKPDKPAPSSTSNGFNKPSQFTKKPSETYKKIAPHTVRTTSEKQEGQLSPEEQEKRTEAASNVLRKSAPRQRSYVLSAAKIYESKEKAPDTSPINSSPAFVAKRVEITDDDESAVTPAPASTVPPSPVVPVTSVASRPQPKPRKIADTSVKTAVDVTVNELVPSKVEKETPLEPVKEKAPPVSVTEEKPCEDTKTEDTKVAAPLPELITDCLQVAPTKPQPEDSDISQQTDTPLVELSPPSQTPISPTQKSPESPAPVSPVLTSTVTESPALLSPDVVSTVPKSTVDVSPVPASTVMESPAPVSPDGTPTITESAIPVSPVQTSTVMESPAPASTVPKSSVPVAPVQTSTVMESPAPASTVPKSSVPVAPVQTPTVMESPALASTVPKSSVPVAPVQTSTVMESPAPASTVPKSSVPVAPVQTPTVMESPALASTVPKSSVPVAPVQTPTVMESPAPASTVPKSSVPVAPVQTPTVMESPAPASTVPKSSVPVAPVQTPTVMESPAPASTVPKSSVPVAPVQTPTVMESPAPASTVPESSVPVAPVQTSTVMESPALVSTVPKSKSPESPVPTSTVTELPAPVSPDPSSPIPVSPAPVFAVSELTVKMEPEPEPEVEPEPEPVPEPESNLPPKPSSSGDTLTALSDTLISFDTSSPSFKDDETALANQDGKSADNHTSENSSVEQKPASELNNPEPITEDLLGFSDGPEESAEPVPPSPGRWSQDLLSGLDSESNPEKTSGTLDLLANDVIVISSEARSLSMQPEEEKQTDETAKETQSKEDNADPWSSHVTTVMTTVTKPSSADPFDPYPIETTSPNSSSDLPQQLSDSSINSTSPAYMENKTPETNMSSNALESLADDIIPISTDKTSLSTQRSWAHTWETSTAQESNTEESQEAKAEPEAEGQAEDQQTLVMFERKSLENDSPWDRWTSPTVYTITSTTGEDEEEEEKDEEEQESTEDTKIVSTITTIREIHSEPKPSMDRFDTYSTTVTEEEQRVPTPEPENKKGFVFVKEYVNATEMAFHNPRDMVDRSDYLTSSSTTYSYSSPSVYSSFPRRLLSSSCTYCGEQVGNDAKITIEHLGINCHPACFKCEVCKKPMGDLLHSMFLHGGKVHCETCYAAI